jgi:Secretory lipase
MGNPRLIASLASVAITTALTVSTASAEIPPPDTDRFYRAPQHLADAQPGAVLRSRPVDLTRSSIGVPHRAWQVLYRTADTTGRPEAAVATVIVPDVPFEGRRPLLSYQPAEDTLTRRCASSYELRAGSGGEPDTFRMALERGWTVVVPDYEGPRSQWVAGVQAGHAVLDAIRAAQRFPKSGVAGRRTPVGIWGYSGGGHATAWASELHPKYAPELRVVGVAHGGASSDLEATARNIDGGAPSGLLFAAAVGLSRAYPWMRLDALLNDAGRTMVKRIGRMCLEEFVTTYPFRRIREFTTVPDALRVPRIQKVLRRAGLTRRAPRAPIHVYHAILDEVNPISASDGMVERYCSLGARVDYERTLLGEHIAVQQSGAPGAVRYLEDRFAGRPVPNDCQA